jgi:hypothetical protein
MLAAATTVRRRALRPDAKPGADVSSASSSPRLTGDPMIIAEIPARREDAAVSTASRLRVRRGRWL